MIVTNESVSAFLAGHRFAVVGASDTKANFGGTIYRELRDHGYEVVAVHPTAETVAGDPCYPDLASVPGELDGAMVVVGREAALDVVSACAERGVPRVWLFKGIGSEGAMSDEAVARCEAYGIEVVAGACPLMFLEPVGWFHKLHRTARHVNHSLAKAG